MYNEYDTEFPAIALGTRFLGLGRPLNARGWNRLPWALRMTYRNGIELNTFRVSIFCRA